MSGYTPIYGTEDAGPAVIDLVVGVFVGMATFALVIGIGIGLGLVARHFPFLKLGK